MTGLCERDQLSTNPICKRPAAKELKEELITLIHTDDLRIEKPSTLLERVKSFFSTLSGGRKEITLTERLKILKHKSREEILESMTGVFFEETLKKNDSTPFSL